MLRKQLNRYYKKFEHNKYIVKFSKISGAENLWEFNRSSVAKAIALGIACAWIPLPFHTIIAIFIATIIDCNIPLVAISIWFANPLTMPFMYYFAYMLGDLILNVHNMNIHFHLSMHDVLEVLHVVWEPFVLGCLISGVICGIFAYMIVQLIWPLLHKKKAK